jgi:hypothetical protein
LVIWSFESFGHFLLLYPAQRGSNFFEEEKAVAQYEHLPIYKKAYDLTLYFEKIVRNFSRYDKYTLGTELRELSREVLRLIRRANDAEDKAPLLIQNRQKLEDLIMAVRLCKDLKAFHNFNSFQFSINEVVGLCKQNEGWLKSMLQKSGGPESSPHTSVGQERANG